MDEIVKDFLIESNENLDRLDQELVKLESEPSSKELLASIFRTIHTIKGSCGFLGFARLEKVAHAGESLLSLLRDGKLTLTAEVTSGLLAMVDAVRRMLAEIQATEHDGENDYPELREKLKLLQKQDQGAASAGAAPPPLAQAPEAPPAPANAGLRICEVPEPASGPAVAAREAAPSAGPGDEEAEYQPDPGKVGGLLVEHGDVSKQQLARALQEQEHVQHRPTQGKIGGLLVERGSIRPEDLAAALQEQERGDQRRLGEILVAMKVCRQEDVLAAQQIIESRGRESGVETVRVGINLLDKLMNLVGELVLSRNQLLQFANSTQDAGFQAISQRMNLVASELQEEVMKTRMQPIGNVWSKFPRTVRDLALSCGKEVRIEMEGKDTELDRTIIEAIKDPLTHLVRNSIDHGIESPEVRKAAGKEPSGCLRLRAFHVGGQVNIEISDDGAGLNRDRIRQKALERGLITSEQAARMQDRDIFNLIFLPGFSTAEKVTKVSGRGVGMDVVRTNVEKIGGTVDVQSTAGQGTAVRVKIPLTLAIIPALLVRCGGERFAIPQVSLTELVRLESSQGIEMVHGAPVYRLRGRLLPLIFLSDQLRMAAGASGMEADGPVNIAVLQAGDSTFGLRVDEIIDTQEIVVKPLGRQLKGLSVYSGATIMGDGEVALILDLLGLAQRAGIVTEAKEAALAEKESGPSKGQGAEGRQTLLLVQGGASGRLAMPLSEVARLEEFPASAIERAGSQEVMQYRGEIIPMIRLSQFLGLEDSASSQADDALMQVVVYSEQGRRVGLIVDRIVDIVEGDSTLQAASSRAGVVGSFVVQKRVTELLDVPALVRAANPGFLDASQALGER